MGVDEQALGTRANGGHFMHLSVSIGHGQAALAPYRAALPHNSLLGPPTLLLGMSCSPLHSAYSLSSVPDLVVVVVVVVCVCVRAYVCACACVCVCVSE